MPLLWPFLTSPGYHPSALLGPIGLLDIRFEMLSKSSLGTDPLAKVLEPNPNESPAEREARLLDEAKAKRMSDSIDEELEKQRIAVKSGPRAIKVLLLGMQSCSLILITQFLMHITLMFDDRPK